MKNITHITHINSFNHSNYVNCINYINGINYTIDIIDETFLVFLRENLESQTLRLPQQKISTADKYSQKKTHLSRRVMKDLWYQGSYNH